MCLLGPRHGSTGYHISQLPIPFVLNEYKSSSDHPSSPNIMLCQTIGSNHHDQTSGY
uniref:Uncharacterized protein n=1 Tax=Arundo donax TaxID=35708 RepID=A0A0A9CJY6_ARUDO